MLIVFLVLFTLIAMGLPIAFAILSSSALYFLTNDANSTLLVQRMVGGLESFPLLAVPFFVLAGTAMARGGIAERLMGFAETIVGHFRGGLAQVNVLNSLLIGGMSGSANADAAIDSKVLVPVMRRRGYSNAFASAITAASSAIAPILPPSIGLIIYGVIADVSIGGLFIGGILPAFLLAVAMAAVVWQIAVRRGYGKARQRASLREILHTGWKSLGALSMPVLLIVGLRAGVFTPTELGALAALYSLVLGLFVYREIRFRDLGSLFREAVVTTGIIMLIIAAAATFSLVIALEQVPQKLIDLLFGITDERLLILLLINLGLLFLGTMMESLSLMIILAPVLAPVAAELGIDPIQFGVMMVLNLTIGSITPPIGTVVYTVCSITRCTVGEFTREFMPLFASQVAVLLMVAYIPWVTTLLPALIGP